MPSPETAKAFPFAFRNKKNYADYRFFFSPNIVSLKGLLVLKTQLKWGTRITQASECFVHWRDVRHEYEWGLNFTTPLDARRFKDCCLSSTTRLSRKASSSGSLRLSPPKRIRNSNNQSTIPKSNSEPSSPVNKPRRAISTPTELSNHNGGNNCCDTTEHRVQHRHIPQTILKRPTTERNDHQTNINSHPSGAQTLPKKFASDIYQNRETLETEKIYGSRELITNASDEDPYSHNAEVKLAASLASSEIEWPPPPDYVDTVTSPPSTSFDSATLKRMLTVLDDSSSDKPPKPPDSKPTLRPSISGNRRVKSSSCRQFGSGSDTTEHSESEDSSTNQTSDSASLNTLPAEQTAIWTAKSTAIRKAGWLHAKNWLIHKKRRVELAKKRVWKRYWVCLKGTTLLMMSEPEDVEAKYILIIENGLVQAVPEHPKREHILALSTAFGDAYLFQATSQVEQENWICAMHSACASCLARQHGKENTLILLKSEIQKLESSIEIDIKMKRMADMKLHSSTPDAKTKAAIERQIAQWDEDLEKLYTEQYRLKCYIASLHNSEVPNAKKLLACISKTTKAALLRLGVCTANTLHALVTARSPATAATLTLQKKGGIMSTFKSDSGGGGSRLRASTSKPSSSGNGTGGDDGEEYVVDLSRSSTYQSSTHGDDDGSATSASSIKSPDGESLRVSIPGGQNVLVTVGERSTCGELLDAICLRKQLDCAEHFIRIRTINATEINPDRTALLDVENIEWLRICAKLLFQIDLFHTEKDGDFGMAVEAELADETEDEIRVFISEINRNGVAGRKGLLVGDEILVLNGRIVAKLDMVYVENILSDQSKISLTIRSCRTELPLGVNACQQESAKFIQQIVVPPPPYQNIMSAKEVSDLILPRPDDSTSTESQQSASVDSLLENAEQVTHFCRLMHSIPEHERRESIEESGNGKQLTDGDRLRKVVKELITTERLYVRDLHCLIERYLEPLKDERFLEGNDIDQLYNNIVDILSFQRNFLNAMEEAVKLEVNFDVFDDSAQFKEEQKKKLLMSLAGSFLFHANNFKLYSTFCANHSKAQKILQSDQNQRLVDFLNARNPKRQHSSTIESFLIKPIQRILKYPLLLAELRQLTNRNSEEYQHLEESLRCMQAVAEHINEMQKIHEEYGCVFDMLVKQSSVDLHISVADLHMYGNVNWLNVLEDVRKVKKPGDLLNIVFVFKQALVLLCQERSQRKRPAGKARQQPPPGPGTEGMEIVRFCTAIPVEELQVRATAVGDTDRHGLWTAVHCKSETEGRPEKRYEFASSINAKTEFLKTIRLTIRDSVKRMNVPSRRPETLSYKRQTVAKIDMTKSLDMDERSAASDSDTSARLTYSSHRPFRPAPKTDLGSPVWKPRVSATYTDYASVQEQRQRRILKAKPPTYHDFQP